LLRLLGTIIAYINRFASCGLPCIAVPLAQGWLTPV
jgi:hypothetical protein